MRRAATLLVLGQLAVLAGVAGFAAQAQENRLPPGPGRDQVIADCSDCHGLVALNGKHMAYQAWYAVIGEMLNNGASVPSEDREAIADYLATNFGAEPAPDAAQPAAK